MALPDVELTAAEAAEAAARGWTWRNYALISGGRVYATPLHTDDDARDDRIIYVDGNRVPWLLTFIVEAAGNTATISATAVRFGEFDGGAGADVPFPIGTVQVACTDITLPTSTSDFGWSIDDVWTNGSKALLSILYIPRVRVTVGPEVGYINARDIYSVIEITPSGDGPGGLSFAAVEVKGGWSETTGSDPASTAGTPYEYSEDWSGTLSPCGDDFHDMFGTLTFSALAGISLLVGMTSTEYYARHVFYDALGAAHVVRLRLHTAQDTVPGTSTLETAGGPACSGNDFSVYVTLHAINSTEWEVALLDGATEIGAYGQTNVADHRISYGVLVRCTWRDDPANGYPPGCYTTYKEGGVPVRGSDTVDSSNTGMLAGVGDTTYWYPDYPTYHVRDLWRVTTHMFVGPDNTRQNDIGRRLCLSDYYLSGGGSGKIGVVAAGGPAYAVIRYHAGEWTLSLAITPAGVLTPPPTPYMYFSWQPKTGEFTFDTMPVCYV